MRRNLTFLLGTVTGICLTALVTGPQGARFVGRRRGRCGGVADEAEADPGASLFLSASPRPGRR